MWRETAQEMFAMLLKGIDSGLSDKEDGSEILCRHLNAAAMELAARELFAKSRRAMDADRVRQN